MNGSGRQNKRLAMNRILAVCSAAWGFLAASFGVLAQPGSPDGLTYKTGYSVIMSLGADLHKALKPKLQSVIHTQPIFLETEMMPSIKPVEYPDETKPMRAVFISAGFIDLMNHVAHAKAIDRIEKGYFQKYILGLAKETGEKELHELPNAADKRYWTEEMMNEQKSNFNQMVGMVVAMTLSHHYLGHYRKYSEKLDDTTGKAVPITTLLTADEWDEAMKAGARNALDAGFGVEGIKALYDCFDKMPQRPAWTKYFLADSVKVSKAKKDLEKIEKKFFAGEDF